MNKIYISNLLDYLLIAIISAIIVLSPWPYGSVGIFAQFYIHLASFLLLLIWLIKRSFYSKDINSSSVYTSLLCFFGLAFISITYSIYRYASILEFLNWFSYLIIFFIVADTINCSKRRNLLLWIIVFVGLFYCGFGILQYYEYLSSKFWSQEHSLSSRYINSGSFGAYINLDFFLCLGLLLSSKGVFRKFILGLALIVFIVTLILSNSRLSWITFVITLIGLTFLLFKNLNSVKTKSLVSALIFGIILASAGWYFWPRIWERISVAQTTQFQSLFQRFDVWKGALKIILAYPFGSGIGTFQYIYPAFRVHSDRFLVDTAHSDLLQIASEVGILGLICFLWFLKSLLVRAFRCLKEEISRQDLLFYLGIICALVSFL
ncbi:MAG: O-antigen ligase family protein, partial [Candidatus Omnitrophica bacterium]|nr:O-antigen ligase family protein [Candidatus Omnitrophota bacterium]